MTIETVRVLRRRIEDHKEKYHRDGCCMQGHPPCPLSEMVAELRQAEIALARHLPAKYGWLRFSHKIATYLPRHGDEEPQMGFGRCHKCGAIGSVYYTAGGKETCQYCVLEQLMGEAV